MKKLALAAMMLGFASIPAHAEDYPLSNFLSRVFGGAPAQQQAYGYAQGNGYGRHHGHYWRHAHYRHGHHHAQRAYRAHYAAAESAAPSSAAPSWGGDHSFTTRASYYGGGPRRYEPNSHTANGERFNQWGLTAAHRSLPMGTRLLVSHGGRSVVVRINDRGPAAWTGRSLDVSRGAAARLGLIGPGVGAVHVTVLASR